MLKYTVVLEWDEEWHGWCVSVPALPGCVTQAKTKKQAIERITEAISGYIATLRDLGREIPTEHNPPVEVEQVEIPEGKAA